MERSTSRENLHSPRERYRKDLLTRKTKAKFAQEKSYETIQETREPGRMILFDIDKPRL